jgi:hypothetical protein
LPHAQEESSAQAFKEMHFHTPSPYIPPRRMKSDHDEKKKELHRICLRGLRKCFTLNCH